MSQNKDPGALAFLLGNQLASHQGDWVPAKCVGGPLNFYWKWEKSDMVMLGAHLGASKIRNLINDPDSLLRFVPRIRFRDPQEMIDWAVTVEAIMAAVAVAERWGFCQTRWPPTNAARWNASLVAGLELVGRNRDGMLEREEIYPVFYLAGCPRSSAIKMIEALKGTV